MTRVKGLDKEIKDEVNELNLKLKYRDLLQNMVISAIDLEFTVNNIFDHSDKAENDLMGALAKDQVFIDTILSLMDHDTRLKRNSLYLMKLASEITVEKCGSNIIFSYIFPILDQHEYRSMRIYNIPKLVNRKCFQLANLPYAACWASRLFAFTWKEFTLCRKIENNRFCKIPTQVNDLLDSCLFGLVEGIPWSSLVD